ncbi:HAD hydrolase-like protein [Pseudoflavitalea sp. G-6-1-2]|uniref:HAD hydrolase-like protein n=1 Tax=Pseudoflavitalea sp. G-6-1-2 TaxID=2728841 RepID=UPI00146BBB3C|nr:HAD hydrolase-like protein [Pseudoflavitalea sp. G-6-1-2]NML23553.1 HAD hydrolase-like protein [Pseudoflavitalea sp. G-6-1-2]
MIKLAVFDMAGTTVVDNNFVGKAFQQAFSKNGYEIALADFNHLMGYHKPTAIRMVLDKIGVDANDQLIETIHDAFQTEMLDFYKHDPAVSAIPEAENIFLYLKEKGIRIALNTGFSREIADSIITRLKWKERGLIDDYIASDEVEQGRPQVFMMQQLMQRAGITDTTLVAKIGDTEVDINEGRNAGCGLVVAVTTGAYTREELAAFNPDHILDSLDELPQLIGIA